MRSPLSPVIAKIYMEGFEEEALDSATDQPSLCRWLCYVDDTFVIWPHEPEKLKIFHSHLNSLRESIQFTIEKEQDNHLPFLDVLVTKEGNHMTTSIYRKKTHTNQYLHYESYHHPRIKSGFMSYLMTRAEKQCKAENVTKEKQHLRNMFVANGYPEEMTRKFFSESNAKAVSHAEEEERKDTL